MASRAVALILAGSIVGLSVAVDSAQTSPRKARIVGKVNVCNGPGRCLTRTFQVSAIDGAGHVVAQAPTSGTDNRYRLRLPAGNYSLVATSNGLRCTGSASAVAGHKVTANITCLVP